MSSRFAAAERTRDNGDPGVGVKRGKLNERVIRAICMSNGGDPRAKLAGRGVQKSNINREARIAPEKSKKKKEVAIGIAHRRRISFAGYAAALSRSGPRAMFPEVITELLRSSHEWPRIIGALWGRRRAGASQTDAGGNR